MPRHYTERRNQEERDMLGGFGMFGIMSILFPIVWLTIFGFIIYTVVKKIKQSRKNDNSPRLTVEAEVIAKRTHVWGDHSHTNYYATFQFESGDRMELEVPYDKIGYLIEGDKGQLTFQGTRFLDFQRQ